MLNYLYAVLESEAQLALAALGLDPGIGVLHNDLSGTEDIMPAASLALLILNRLPASRQPARYDPRSSDSGPYRIASAGAVNRGNCLAQLDPEFQAPR
jgi:CRISPR associated protein Cas1